MYRSSMNRAVKSRSAEALIAEMENSPSVKTITAVLQLENFEPVFDYAKSVNATYHDGIVELRAIVEFSNYCACACRYCGLNCTNAQIKRYRMSEAEIIERALEAETAGYRTVVLQSGEDAFFTKEKIAFIVSHIKRQSKLAVTLSIGERSFEELQYFRAAGADRFLLKHETADAKLYEKLHPDHRLEDRLQCLRNIKALGYETGSGFIIGVPQQTTETIARDILLLKDLPCDMAGIGPLIPCEGTALENEKAGDPLLTKKAVALTRIILPQANLPATTALEVLEEGASTRHVFDCGANVIMRKVTPQKYEELYKIYPSHITVENIFTERKALEEKITRLGYIPR